MILTELTKQKKISPPDWHPGQTQYLTYMGSTAYGVSGEMTDRDVYGFCIPPKEIVFPHTAGFIAGFRAKPKSFGQYEQHHVIHDGNSWDFVIYNVVKYFDLVIECNPNMIDSIFTPRRCIIHITEAANWVRQNANAFLSKKAYHTFKGYAYAQMTKIENKSNSSNPKRAADIEKHGYDTKFAYHLIRLVDECAMILAEHTLDLERNSAILKSIRNGEFTLDRLREMFASREKMLAELYAKSTLQEKPNEVEIKALLLEVLESHYGSLEVIQNSPLMKLETSTNLLADLKQLVKQYE